VTARGTVTKSDGETSERRSGLQNDSVTSTVPISVDGTHGNMINSVQMNNDGRSANPLELDYADGRVTKRGVRLVSEAERDSAEDFEMEPQPGVMGIMDPMISGDLSPGCTSDFLGS